MNMNFCRKVTNVCFLIAVFTILEAHAKSDPGIIETVFTMNNGENRVQRPLLANTKIFVKMECTANRAINVTVYWTLIERDCWVIDLTQQSDYDHQLEQNQSKELIKTSPQINAQCNLESHIIVVPDLPISKQMIDKSKSEADAAGTESLKPNVHPLSPTPKPVTTVSRDAIYEFVLSVKIAQDAQDAQSVKFEAPVHIEFLGPHGYISAQDWPLLPFYGIMCFVYLIYGIIWLVVSFMQWRDLLRIQFWIGGVILLGMLEKAFFYAQYHSLNTRGVPVEEAELAAEFVSCAKRTLARMLVIIMSLGFGIVKPRLGPMLHRVVGVGALYFVLACVESYLRVTHTKPEELNELLVASIPLAVLDTGICWWIFTSLVQTTRTLRLRRNMVKLSLYRHFTNTLIFSVIASVIFMLFAMRLRKSQNCTPGWRDIWIDTAFWHILFSVLLLVIMILWRPTNNNQRYAFTPLLDSPEDEDEDEEDQFVADAYGVKMRGSHTMSANGGAKSALTSSQRTTTTEDDDLRWVEENIPSAIAEHTLPVLDSDEEIINTKFEVSKMQ